MSKNFISPAERDVAPVISTEQALGMHYAGISAESAAWVQQVVEMCFPHPAVPLAAEVSIHAVDEFASERAEVAAAFSGNNNYA